MRQHQWIMTILTLMLLTIIQTNASELPPVTGGYSTPYILMTPVEIQHLPHEDRVNYLGSIRHILAQSEESLLLATTNDCASGQKQCEPSIFGDNVCIAKHASAKSECSEKMKKDKSFSENTWGSYFLRLQNFCKDSQMQKTCKNLENKRISIFNQRKTH